MGATTSHHRGCGSGYSGRSIQPQNVFWGWSNQNQQLEMMDLPAYLDSLRQTYDTALRDLSDRMQSLSTMFSTPPYAPAGRRHHHRHHHHHDHGHGHHDCGSGGHRHDDCGCGGHDDCGCGGHKSDCGCGHDDCGCRGCGDHDCGCECCVEDADVIVYAHCGELRVVPIEVANDTRREREDVTVEVSEVRSAGGRELPWMASVNPKGPLTLPPCSTTKLELVVYVNCKEKDPSNGNGNGNDAKPARRAADKGAAKADEAAAPLRAVVVDQYESGDVDQCEVGYVTIRLGGCLVSPIVVAIAALPDRCDTYRAGCSCSCCC